MRPTFDLTPRPAASGDLLALFFVPVRPVRVLAGRVAVARVAADAPVQGAASTPRLRAWIVRGPESGPRAARARRQRSSRLRGDPAAPPRAMARPRGGGAASARPGRFRGLTRQDAATRRG